MPLRMKSNCIFWLSFICVGKTVCRVLDKDTRGGIFYKTSLIPVPGSGETDNRGVFSGKSQEIGYFQIQARQLTPSAF